MKAKNAKEIKKIFNIDLEKISPKLIGKKINNNPKKAVTYIGLNTNRLIKNKILIR